MCRETPQNHLWTFKRDWYDLDHLYLRAHPEFRAFRIFSSIEDFHDNTLAHYPEEAYNRQIRYITRFYREAVVVIEEDLVRNGLVG